MGSPVAFFQLLPAGAGAAAAVLAVVLSGFGVFCWIVGRTRSRIKQKAVAAEAALASGDFSTCLRLCDEALAAARVARLRPEPALGMVLLLRSRAARQLGRNAEALTAVSQALACLRGARSNLAGLPILDQLGTLLVDMRLERRAIPILEAVTRLGQAVDSDPLRNCSRLQYLGLAYLRVGVHANSVAAFARAIEIGSKKLGPDALSLAGPYINLGNGYKHMHKMDDAERCYREALRLYDVNHVKEPEKYSAALMNLGVACAETGRNQDAELCYGQVLDIRLAALGRNDWRVGTAYNNLAMCKLRSRDFGLAEEYIQNALEILDSRPESLAHALGTLSMIREEQGRMEEALAAAARAREVQMNLQTPDLSELATRFEREGSLAARIGDEERASSCRQRAAQFRQALASAPSPGNDPGSSTEALKTLDQRLKASLEHFHVMQQAL